MNLRKSQPAKPKPEKAAKVKRGGGIKRTTADAMFSNCVRERSNWTCERCGTRYEPPTGALHCSHFFGRGSWAIRHDPDNADALCYGCHRFFGSNPTIYAEWHEKKIGKERTEILVEKRENPLLAKQAHREEKQMVIHYLGELQMMKLLRQDGATGWLDFQGYL